MRRRLKSYGVSYWPPDCALQMTRWWGDPVNKVDLVSAFVGSYISVQRESELKGARLHHYLTSVKISATKLKCRCHEEYYRMELDLVREDFLLKGKQELFRQGGLFLDKGTAYTKPRGREHAQGGAKCQDGSSTQAGERQLAGGQVPH